MTDRHPILEIHDSLHPNLFRPSSKTVVMRRTAVGREENIDAVKEGLVLLIGEERKSSFTFDALAERIWMHICPMPSDRRLSMETVEEVRGMMIHELLLLFEESEGGIN